MFSNEVCEIFKNTLSYRTPPWLLLLLRWLFLYLIKKVLLNSNFATLLDVLIIFSSQHTVRSIKIRTRLFINLPSIVRFSKYLCQDVLYKAENWHAWSHEQYFSKHRFLDICQCAFKNFSKFTGKYLCLSLFLIKLRAFRSATLLKRDSNSAVFLWILRNF